ncbi:MAG TPA: VWA domain-containing protein [Pyrinomonadaceae bacterium]|nr:VWA domain-containing protein [Pyrinomonadaceae bacterium]
MQHRATLALLLLFSIFLPLPSVGAQTKPANDKDDVVRITTNLVQIDAVVTKDGKPVPNLKAEDFEIYEDGRKQAITSFTYISNVSRVPSSTSPAAPDKGSGEAPPPGPIQRDAPRRTIAVVVDDLGLSFESINQARRQLRKFVTEQLQPNDLVAIVRTGGEIGTLQQFTNDKRLLTRAVDQLRWNVCSRMGVSVFPRYGQALTGFDWEQCDPFDDGTDRALHFILDALAKIPGRKSMIFMSDDMPLARHEEQTGADGVSVGSTVPVGPTSMNRGGDLQKITEKAIRASVVIYSIDTQGLQFTGLTAADNVMGGRPLPGPQKKSPLDDARPNNKLLNERFTLLQSRREGSLRIARQTGGFQVTNSNGFQLDRILEDQSGYYLLGYRPGEETFNRQFHQIKVKVKGSGLTARTRYGFYGVTEEEAKRAQPPSSDETNLALGSPFGAQDLELNLNSFFANGKTEGSIVRSFIYLKAGNLTFTPNNGRHDTSLDIHGVIFGNNGAIVEQVKHSAVLSLREGEYQQALREGLRLRYDIPAKNPGSYQVRIAVRDRTSSKIGSAGQVVAVPNLNENRMALSGIVLRGAGEGPMQLTAMVNPPARGFPANSDLQFAFVIYNAAIEPATRLPNLTIQTRLFRDGKSIGPMAETPIDVKSQPDLSRLFINGAVRLSSNLDPGDYYLQVVITDKAASNKKPPITQWVDFEVVK